MLQIHWHSKTWFKLRFSGFTDEWVSYKIGDISKTYSGGTPSTSKREYYKGNIPFIKSGEIGNEVTEQYINEEAINNSSAKKVQKGDLLLALYGATSGEVAISKIDGAINQAVLKIDNKMNNYFQYNYFVKYKDQIIHKYLQGGQGNLSANIIKKLEFYYPNLEEQQKISNYLLLIDNKIELLEKKHHEYQNFKKYLMQQIFAQKLRFAKFDYEWVDYPLKDIGKIITGTTPSTKNKDNFSDNGYLWVTLGDISNKRIVTSTERNLSKEGLNNGRELPPNSILVTCIGATIGKICMIKKVGSCNQQLNAIIPNEQFDPDFIYYIIQYNAERLKLIAGNTATPILNKKSFGNIKFEFPKLKEQQKISRLLTSMDDAIDNIESGIKNIQYFKNGLLQQMFVCWRNLMKKLMEFQIKLCK